MDMVERVARALCKRCRVVRSCDCKGEFGGLVDDARAAIAAMSEPTPEMADAFCKAWRNPAFHGTDTEAYGLAFAAMIDAALTS